MALRVQSRLSLAEVDKGQQHVMFIIKGGASQIAHRRFSDWDAVGRGSVLSRVRTDADFHSYARGVTEHFWFDSFIMFSITMNALLMALETDYRIKYAMFNIFETCDEFFMAIYTMEFVMKVYVEPVDYWKSGYNVFDAVILFLSFIPWITTQSGGTSSLSSISAFRAVRVLRVLKTVSFIRGLQALTAALLKTMKSLMYVLTLMLLLMFIFAVIGHEFFGEPVVGDPEHWGDIGSAFFTLFSLVTVDGWTDLQSNLDDLGLVNSRPFTIVFILLGYFILFNMFGGVVIMEIHHATKGFENEIQSERETSLAQKKQGVLQRQKHEIRDLLRAQKGMDSNYSALVGKFKRSLRHTDITLMDDLCTSTSFIDIYMTSLDLQDATVERLQKFYAETLLVLSDLLSDDLVEEADKELSNKKLELPASHKKH
ncbi:cation channel sperm-associated protein 3-like [Sardina pilchardus]|uniref:cation channel sperm-associated protein 3-like n=1 Tax=Sardina pilchardus TaxID=27697 RepID=UPI002E0D9EC6